MPYIYSILLCRGYMAPELIGMGRRSIKSDIFSLGVTITELVTGSRLCWEKQSVEQVRWNFQITSGSKCCHRFIGFYRGLTPKDRECLWASKIVYVSLYRYLNNWVEKDHFHHGKTNTTRQVRTCLEIGYNCVDADPDKRPTALEIIQRLDETVSTNFSAPPYWQILQIESMQILKVHCSLPLYCS